MYEKHFPLKKRKLKTKDLKSPWISAGIKKSSKRKQRLYTKFLKNRNQKTRQNIRTIKTFRIHQKTFKETAFFKINTEIQKQH